MSYMTDEERANQRAWLETISATNDRILGRDKTARPVAEPFSQQADLVTAMQDPRYKTDGDYRRSVAERLAAGRGMRL